jgi:glycosyltransferase involved in cell wall biosynthesis
MINHGAMNIGFDAKRIFHNATGLGNYSRDTVRLLSGLYPDHNYILYNPKPGHIRFEPSHENTQIRYPDTYLHRTLSSYWRYRLMVSQLIKDRIDVYFGLSNEIPRGIENTGIRTVVTIHDLIFLRYPHFYPAIDRRIYRHKFLNACLNADRIIAISEQTKHDIIQFFKIPEEKIKVVYQGCHEMYQREQDRRQHDLVRKKYDLPERFILNVGRIEERKNALSIVQAIRPMPDIHLVIVGRKTPYAGKIESYLNQQGMEDRVHIFNSIPLSDLPAFYQMADIFVYPSFFEGFGIPIIEALFSKTPVISSTGSCFSEAGGPDSKYVPPADVDALGNSILELWEDAPLRSDMADKGVLYASKFKDPVIAQELFETIESLKG